MKHITSHRPDTCGCELHYEWDDAVPAEERVHTPVSEFIDNTGNVRKPLMCQHHQTAEIKAEVDAEIAAEPDVSKHAEIRSKVREAKAKDVEAHFSSVLKENVGKNKVLGLILETDDGDVAETKIGTDGSSYKEFKTDHAPAWSFDENRKLIVAFHPGKKMKKAREDVLKATIVSEKQKGEIGIDVEIR